MDQLETMRVFLEVAERASFAAAARTLRISPAAATRAVAALESDLAVSLLSRTTRAVRLTDSGATYADHCRRILSQVEEARATARGEEAAPHGILRVTAPILFGRLHVLPIVEALSDAHPALCVKLTLVDRVVHLVEEGFDVAVRIGAMADSALRAVKLAEVRRVLVASPAYLDRHGAPATPQDLRKHQIVSFDGIGSTDEWRFGNDLRTVVRVQPNLSVNCAQAAVDATVRGAGIARLLSYQVAEAVTEGLLQIVLQDVPSPPLPVSLVFPASTRRSPNVRQFESRALGHFRTRGNL